ncbi:hypothetical protein [Sabulicella rubraurantiaca]|uniref:hypothetical protein n=1 Tax=Sabulicella rubraurantiaca TaxID=2811429 RepID=UPI001A979A36|nr:hypothetical protein [Sabulicella rubraurantiaca]
MTMMKSAGYAFLVAGCTLLATPSAQAQAQQRPGATVAYTTEVAATVESVDPQKREIVLRGPGGNLFAVMAGPAVENFDRIRPGERVVVRYVEALAATLASPGQGGGGSATEQLGVARHAPPGSSPTGTVGSQVRATVRVDAVDRAAHTITFSGPANVARTVAVRDPEARRFLETLKPGDNVNLVYTESMAVAVEPMGR